MTTVDFNQIEGPTPDYDEVVGQYDVLRTRLEQATTGARAVAVIQDWDALQRRLETWSNLAELRFEQDTTNEQYRAARRERDQVWPKLTELAIAFKRQILAGERSGDLEHHFGPCALNQWKAHVTTYDPKIEQDMVREAELELEYTELLASARLPFQGETYNLSRIVKFREDPDRAVRHSAEQVRWQWFFEHRAELDRIFDDQVRLRTSMARKLGFDDFVGLGYQRMVRVDYGREEVERFRDAVREQVTPLAETFNRRRAQQLGVDSLMSWDEGVFDPRGNPAPRGDHDWMLEQAQHMFDSMGGGLDDFFRVMTNSHLLDLKARDGKAGGGFCTSLDSYGLPFIFANFNGTKGDVEVFTHEVGHAFQNYLSRAQPLLDYTWPTYESCEIHSMSLEFLAWPEMERFFGDDAQRFRRIHLAQSLLFLPYGAAVDHFQHRVYEQPDATPDQRHAMWREMEQLYLPWRDYGDLEHPALGGFWQSQRHIYSSPFYYIDYTLALTCALQFWVRSRENPTRAMNDYVALCRRGGSLPFQQLAASADLVSPFEPSCLGDAVEHARQYLDLTNH